MPLTSHPALPHVPKNPERDNTFLTTCVYSLEGLHCLGINAFFQFLHLSVLPFYRAPSMDRGFWEKMQRASALTDLGHTGLSTTGFQEGSRKPFPEEEERTKGRSIPAGVFQVPPQLPAARLRDEQVEGGDRPWPDEREHDAQASAGWRGLP